MAGFGNFYELLFSFYRRLPEAILTHEIEEMVTYCKRFKAMVQTDREYLWRELETGLTSQKFIRAYVCSHASKEAQQKALLSMLVHFDLVETQMIRDGVECERLRMFARDMRRAVELQGKNSEGIRAMIPRKGSILLPPDLMAPNSRADSTPDSPVLSEQQQRVPTNAMNNSLRQQRLICFRRGASGLVGLKLRKGERPSCGLFFIEDIVPGGAADVSSGFNVGDIVHAVNELQVVHDTTLDELLTFCKGPPNTPVTFYVSSPSAVACVSQKQPLAAGSKGLVQRDTCNSHESRSQLLSTQQGALGSRVERNVDWRRGLEAVGEQMREERRGVRRERGIESGEMVEVNVRLRPKTPVEIGVDGWML